MHKQDSHEDIDRFPSSHSVPTNNSRSLPSENGAVTSVTENKKPWKKVFSLTKARKLRKNARRNRRLGEAVSNNQVSSEKRTSINPLPSFLGATNPVLERTISMAQSKASKLPKVSTSRLSRKSWNNASSDDKKSRLSHRQRSNSTHTFRKRRKQRKKAELEERERRRNVEQMMRTNVQNITQAISMQNRDLFVASFAEEGPMISHPVGILVEQQPEVYFDNFVKKFSMVAPTIQEGSVVIDYSRLAFHCETGVSSQYSAQPESTQFYEPQHWHFEFELSYWDRNSPVVGNWGDDITEMDRESRQAAFFEGTKHDSDTTLLTEFRGKPRLFIKRWYVFSSLSKSTKLNERTWNDTWMGVKTWTNLGYQYGVKYLNKNLMSAFSTEEIPHEVTAFCSALDRLDVQGIVNLFTPKCKAIVVEGIFQQVYDQMSEEDLHSAIHTLVKNLNRMKLLSTRCDNAFRCGAYISARLVLNVKKDLIPAFLLLRTSVEKKTGKIGRIKEFLLCTPSVP